MAKIHLSRLKKRTGYTNEKYTELMQKIISNNSERIHNSVNSITNKAIEKVSKKITTKGKIFSTPTASELVKPQSIWIRKGVERGKLMTDSLRNKLDKDLKSILSDPKYLRTRGALTGTLKDQAIKDMYKKVEGTFTNYTKVDKTIGVPKNIKAIASTEIRSVVNQANQEYMDKILRKNDDVEIIKRWIHNGNVWGSRTYKARREHKRLHRTEVPQDSSFVIKDSGNVYYALYPHDPSLPASQVISCNCSVQYVVRKLKKSEKKGK